MSDPGSSRSQPRLSAEQQATFAADGVVKVEGAVAPELVEAMLLAADEQVRSPGSWVTDTNPGADHDRLFTSRYRWRDDQTIKRFMVESGVAGLMADALQSKSMRFYFDHLLIKEPMTEAPTPWHQDIPYWPFLGRQIGSVWVALTEATVAESGLEFVRGSHLWDKYYAPESFDQAVNWTAEFDGERVPDVSAARHDYDIVGFDVEPGDAIVFSAWVIHGAPGNGGPNRRVAFSTRWLGDDAVWAPHPGCDPTITQDDVDLAPGQYPADDDAFPLILAR